jgi:hypothetical protein
MKHLIGVALIAFSASTNTVASDTSSLPTALSDLSNSNSYTPTEALEILQTLGFNERLAEFDVEVRHPCFTFSGPSTCTDMRAEIIVASTHTDEWLVIQKTADTDNVTFSGRGQIINERFDTFASIRVNDTITTDSRCGHLENGNLYRDYDLLFTGLDISVREPRVTMYFSDRAANTKKAEEDGLSGFVVYAFANGRCIKSTQTISYTDIPIELTPPITSRDSGLTP